MPASHSCSLTSSKVLAMRRPRSGSYRVAAAVALLVTTTKHELASAFSSISTCSLRVPVAADIARVRRSRSENHYRRDDGRFGLALNSKSQWRTAIDAEEKTAATNLPSGAADNFPRFFDGTSSDNEDDNQKSNDESNSDTAKGPLGFLKRDVSPLAIDEEWTFSLNSVDSAPSSASRISETGENDSTGEDVAMMAGAGIAVALAAVAVTALGLGLVDDFSIPGPTDVIASAEQFFADPTSTLEGVVQKVEEMGPSGLLYFGLVYTVAEILAIPAIPLTASAGYLFGTVQGTSVVLVSASIAAAVSFIIGRTLLRSYVEEVLEEYPKFAKIDKAIGREGFKLMVLLRLSPIFPFALSNYLYGATSVQFWPFFLGTLVGFTPGTIAYVSTGSIGKALTLDSASAYPWYAYAGGFAALTVFLKVAADVATGIIEELDEEA